MKNKLLFLILTLLGLLLFSSGCGSDKVGGANEKLREDKLDKSVKIAVGVLAPEALEILEASKPLLIKRGVDLQIIKIDNSEKANTELVAKKLDANFSQSKLFLDEFNQKNFNQKEGDKLSYLTRVYFAPLNILPGRIKNLDDFPAGITIGVPDTPELKARGILLLETASLLTVNPDAGLKATEKDIIENPENLQFKTYKPEEVSQLSKNYDLVLLSGDLATKAGYDLSKDVLAKEDKDSVAGVAGGQILAVRTGDEKRKELGILSDVVNSTQIRKLIEDKYRGTIIPVF